MKRFRLHRADRLLQARDFFYFFKVYSVRLLAFSLTALVLWPPAVRPDSTEYLFKSAVLSNFARMIEWPGSAFSGPDAPIVLCVLDPVPFGESLAAIDGKIVQGRRLAVRICDRILPSDTCHILFANSADAAQRMKAVQAVSGRPVLVVGEDEGFALSEGMIGLFAAKNKIVFEINPVRTEAAGLKISSRLLKLGRIISAGGRK